MTSTQHNLQAACTYNLKANKFSMLPSLLSIRSAIIVSALFIISATGSGGGNDDTPDPVSFNLISAQPEADSSISQLSVKPNHLNDLAINKANDSQRVDISEQKRLVLELLMIGLSVAGNHQR